MLPLKDILYLVAILVAYGIAGRMDYEDAIALAQVLEERERQVADCPDGTPNRNASKERTADGRFIPASHLGLSEPCFRPEP